VTLNIRPNFSAYALVEKGAVVLTLALVAALALVWLLAFFTIGSLGTSHLWEYFGVQGFAWLIFVGLGGLFANQVTELATRARRRFGRVVELPFLCHLECRPGPDAHFALDTVALPSTEKPDLNGKAGDDLK
jgi:hypothetical protein